MGLLVLLGALAAATADAPASGPAAQPAAAAAAQASTGVVRYGPAYFSQIGAVTAWDVIQKLPGFAFDPGQQVRGFAGAAGNVLIDGDRPTTKQDDLQSILQRIPVAQVDHVELIRGGAPGIDMHGQTVLANVVRKTGSGLSGVTAVAGNVFSDGRATGAARLEMTKKWDGKTLEVSLLPSSFVDDGAGDGNRVRTDPDGNLLIRSHLNANAGGFQVTGSSAYETPSAGGKLKLNLFGYFEHYYDNEHDHLTPPGAEVLLYRQNNAKGEVDLHYEKKLTPRLFLEALAIQQVQHQEFPSVFTTTVTDEQDVFGENNTSSESIVRGVLRWRQSDELSIETSAEGAFNIQGSDSAYAVNGADQALPAAKVTVSEKRGEAAVVSTWRPSKLVTLEAGSRFEISQIASSGDEVLSKTLFYPKPRVVLTLSPDPSDQLRFRVEHEVGQLNFADFAAASALGAGNSTVHAGNPNLNPQTDWAFEGAYERHLFGAVLVVTYRHLQISDVEDRIPVLGDDGQEFDAPGNIGDATENDILANFSVPLDWLGLKHAQVKGQGTVRHSRVRDPTTGQERSISGQHRFDYEAHFTQDIPKWKSTWGVDVFNRWTQTNFRFNEVDVYKLKTWVDLYIDYKPRPDLSLHAELDNAGGRGYERLLYVYNGPRNTSGLAYIDDRRQDFKPYLYFRIRKTWG